MLNIKLTLLGLTFASGLLLMAIAIPLMRGRIPRNPIYGFRTLKTLSADYIWYPANKFMGDELFKCGLIISGGCVLLTPFAILMMRLDTIGMMLALLALVPIGIAVVRGFRYTSRL